MLLLYIRCHFKMPFKFSKHCLMVLEGNNNKKMLAYFYQIKQLCSFQYLQLHFPALDDWLQMWIPLYFFVSWKQFLMQFCHQVKRWNTSSASASWSHLLLLIHSLSCMGFTVLLLRSNFWVSNLFTVFSGNSVQHSLLKVLAAQCCCCNPITKAK